MRNVIYTVQREEWEDLYGDGKLCQSSYTPFEVTEKTFFDCVYKLGDGFSPEDNKLQAYMWVDNLCIDLNVTQAEFTLIADFLEGTNQ